MMDIDISEIQIEKVLKSNVSSLEWDNLAFGKVFSDHMMVMDYTDGEWNNPKIMPYKNLSMSPATSALHYGQSIFEGMKAHKNVNDEIVLLRPRDNARRLNVSAQRMCIPPISEEFFMEALKTLLELDREWVPNKKGCSLYIRPFIFATDPVVGIKPSETYRFIIFSCPVGTYYSDAIPVKIETKFTRAASGGTGYAKAAGNYGGALYPAKLAQNQGYKQLIWTDSKEHKYIEEAGTMNVMFIIDGVLITPASNDTILAGLTRDSVLAIARDWGIEVQERKVSVEEIITGLKKGSVSEAFGAGTAATLAPIKSINYNNQDYFLPETESKNRFSTKLMSYYDDYRRDLVEDKFLWLEKF